MEISFSLAMDLFSNAIIGIKSNIKIIQYPINDWKSIMAEFIKTGYINELFIIPAIHACNNKLKRQFIKKFGRPTLMSSQQEFEFAFIWHLYQNKIFEPRFLFDTGNLSLVRDNIFTDNEYFFIKLNLNPIDAVSAYNISRSIGLYPEYRLICNRLYAIIGRLLPTFLQECPSERNEFLDILFYGDYKSFIYVDQYCQEHKITIWTNNEIFSEKQIKSGKIILKLDWKILLSKYMVLDNIFVRNRLWKLLIK